jgi:sec-independent protein translocase protein TatA
VPSIGAPELIILLVVIMVLFGAKRLPDSARSLGRSMRILKAETKGLREDDDTTAHRDTTVTAQPLPPVQAPPAAGTSGTAGSAGHVAGTDEQPRP